MRAGAVIRSNMVCGLEIYSVQCIVMQCHVLCLWSLLT